MSAIAAHSGRGLFKPVTLTIFTLTLLVWFVSHWYAFGVGVQAKDESRDIALAAGCVVINDLYFPGIDPAPWHLTGRVLDPPGGHWYWTWSHVVGLHVEFLRVPLWWAPLVAAAPPVWLVYRRRSARGQCPTCGYDLAGLPSTSSLCPECGTPRPRGTPRRA